MMGSANNICSDKTDIFTMNKVTVTNIWVGKNNTIKVYDQTSNFNDYFKNDRHTQIFI